MAMEIIYDGTEENPLVVERDRVLNEARARCPCCGHSEGIDTYGWRGHKSRLRLHPLRRARLERQEFRCWKCGSKWWSDWYEVPDPEEY